MYRLYRHRKSHRGMFQRQNTTPSSQFCFIFFTWFLVECVPFWFDFSHTKPAQSPIGGRKKKIVSGSRFFPLSLSLDNLLWGNTQIIDIDWTTATGVTCQRTWAVEKRNLLLTLWFRSDFSFYYEFVWRAPHTTTILVPSTGATARRIYARESCRWWWQQQ